jgi:tetratricopeptide (TPR) repeat protein
MSEGELWLLVSQAWPLIDVGGYSAKDWLVLCTALFAIGVFVHGLWQAYRFSKGQIVKRLHEYLEDDAAAIREARRAVIRHIRYAEPLPRRPNHPFFRDFKRALGALDNGDAARAEQRLTELSKIGGMYVSNAAVQTATALLVLGRIAVARSDSAGAKSAWETALKYNPEDAEAARYLGELALALGDVDTAWEQFARAAELAPEDRLAKAEMTELRARYYRDRKSLKLELGALNQSAPNFAKAGAHDRAAAAYARAGEIAAQLGIGVQAPASLRRAYDSYKLAGDRAGMKAMRDSLETLGEDVSGLPTFVHLPKTPRFRVRLAIGLPILAAIAYALFRLQ